jgi:hypothetical protein
MMKRAADDKKRREEEKRQANVKARPREFYVPIVEEAKIEKREHDRERECQRREHHQSTSGQHH